MSEHMGGTGANCHCDCDCYRVDTLESGIGVGGHVRPSFIFGVIGTCERRWGAVVTSWGHLGPACFFPELLR